MFGTRVLNSIRRGIAVAVPWIWSEHRWLKVPLFGVIVVSFSWAAFSFWKDAAAWRKADIGERPIFFGKSQQLGAIERWGETTVSLQLDVDHKTGDVVATVRVSSLSPETRSNREEDLFLVIRRPVFRDPLFQSRYDRTNRTDRWIKLDEPMVGLIEWIPGWKARSPVISMSPGAWWMRPFGSYEDLWALYLARAKKNGVQSYGPRDDAVLEMLPIKAVTLSATIGFDVEASIDDVEEQRKLLRLDGARWVDDGEIGLFRVSFQSSSGVKAFWIFLLAFVSLSVVFLLWKPRSEYSGLELLGALASFGAVRAIVVGDKLVPSFVDVYLGALLVLLGYVYLFSRRGGQHPRN